MYNILHTTPASNPMRKLAAAVAIGAVAMAFIAAGPAHADTKKGTGTAKGCLIENDGKLETVPVGSKIGLFTCGSDGEWHFGWLINAISVPGHKTVKPISTGTIQHGVLRTAKVHG
jgi:hypothetical protein